MKNVIVSAVIMSFVLVSCYHDDYEPQTMMHGQKQNSAAMYSCPIHSGFYGKKGETCPKCGTEMMQKENCKH